MFAASVGGNAVATKLQCNYFDPYSEYNLPVLAEKIDNYYESDECTDYYYYYTDMDTSTTQ